MWVRWIQIFEIRPEPDVAGYLPVYPAGTRTGVMAVSLLHVLMCVNSAQLKFITTLWSID